jgi:hypothetical protein
VLCPRTSLARSERGVMAEHVPEIEAQQVGPTVWGTLPSAPPATTKVPSKGSRPFRYRERESPALVGGRGVERGHSVRACNGRRESPEPDGPGLVPDRPEGDEHDGMDRIGDHRTASPLPNESRATRGAARTGAASALSYPAGVSGGPQPPPYAAPSTSFRKRVVPQGIGDGIEPEPAGRQVERGFGAAARASRAWSDWPTRT